MEERESRPETCSRRGANPLHDRLGELVAREAAAVEHLPDGCPNGLDLVGVECRVQDALGIAPGWKPHWA